MKIRYTRQYNQVECGPVAVLNALKWVGGAWTYKKHIAFIKAYCEYDTISGTHMRDVRRALKHFVGKAVRSRVEPILHLDQIKNHIAKGGAIILLYRTSPDSFHFSFVVEHHEKKGKLLWVNNTMQRPKITVTPEELELIIMSQSQFGDISSGLFITKS